MWLEYFPQATIHGLDIDPARVASIDHPRFVGHVVDHEDLSSITQLIAQISPLVLLDDGSHFWPHQLITLEHLSSLVLNNGLLIVEDLEVCYQPLAATYSRGPRSLPPSDSPAIFKSSFWWTGDCPTASASVQMSNRDFSSSRFIATQWLPAGINTTEADSGNRISINMSLSSTNAPHLEVTFETQQGQLSSWRSLDCRLASLPTDSSSLTPNELFDYVISHGDTSSSVASWSGLDVFHVAECILVACDSDHGIHAQNRRCAVSVQPRTA